MLDFMFEFVSYLVSWHYFLSGKNLLKLRTCISHYASRTFTKLFVIYFVTFAGILMYL